MTIVESVILGLVQGLTEFLPVSSSGHLGLAGALLGRSLESDALLFDIVMHVGTLVAVVVVYRKILWQLATHLFQNPFKSFHTEKGRMVWLIVAAMVPTGIIALSLGPVFQSWTSTPMGIGIALMLNSVLLMSTFRVADTAAQSPMKLSAALWVGAAQGIAVLRGVSRSGATISAGIRLGFSREQAAQFSFLLSIPAILGALVKEFDLDRLQEAAGFMPLFAGFVTSLLSGYVALKILLNLVNSGKLYYFSIYCFVVGLAAVLYM